MDFHHMICTLCIVVHLYFSAAFAQKTINIGAVFHENNPDVELAFRYAVDRFNLYSDLYRLKPIVHRISDSDNFKAGQIVCQMMGKGVAAIFGPDSAAVNEIIESISTSLEIPQFQVFWNPKLGYASPQTEFDKPNLAFNLYPEANALAKSFATLLREMKWKTYTIVYETDEGLVRLQEVLKHHRPDDDPVTVRKLGPGPDHRPLLKEIKDSSVAQIILDCETDHILDILEQAKEVNLMEEYYSYILTSLDAHTLDFATLNISHTNITSLRLTDPDSSALRTVAKDWEIEEEKIHNRHLSISASSIRASVALVYDAINLFATVYGELDLTERIEIKPLKCEGWEISDHGLRMSAFIKIRPFTKGQMIGPITGPLEFDSSGRRIKFALQTVELSGTEGFRVTGTWHSTNPSLISFAISSSEKERAMEQKLQEKVFRVTSRLGAPYLMIRKPIDGRVLVGNDQFEGYSLDLIDGIAKILNFSYKFELVPDNNYGSYDKKKKEWNGLIRQLLDRKADLAICDLTITYERRKAVDFTMPFMTLGISILYSKAAKEPPELFSFMSPLSFDVWLYMATAYLGISIMIFLVARLAPADWENPHPCEQRPEELENIWNLKNCFWLTLGSIMAQGCDILPKGISTRTVTGMWWFFSLIMTASYTANLAAFLTMERMGPTIENAEDLAKQTKIKYGLVEGGATAAFFRESNFSTYQRMWTQMEQAEPSVFEKNNADGVKRVLTSKRMYAFLMESSSLEYEIERNCDLMQVGPWLDVKGYGIAMPVNSPYRTRISGAVLKMQEEGKLTELKKKWWKDMHGGGKCRDDKLSSDASSPELGLYNVGGVFVVLAAGIFGALLVAVIEFLWNVRKVAIQQHITPKEALAMELRFAVNIWVTKKRTKPKTAVNS